MMGKALGVVGCFQLLTKIGLDFGYYLDPARSFYICPLADELEMKAAFASMDLPVKYCRGHRYVGGFVGSKSMQDRWVEPMVEKWVEGVKAMAKVATRYPQSAYHGFTQSLQSSV